MGPAEYVTYTHTHTHTHTHTQICFRELTNTDVGLVGPKFAGWIGKDPEKT